MAGPSHVLVAVAWPYANGPLHLGHIAGSLLPPDIFGRYHAMAGRKVLMVSGSDMHGTPITVKAEQEGVTPEALAARYHAQHKADLAALGIEFGGAGHGDFGPQGVFTSTATPNHRAVVHDIFRTLLARGDIARRSMRAPFDPKAKRFLPDRYVEGTCPHCDFPDARGDQCDHCGRTLDPQELKNPRSKLSGAAPEYRDTEHFFLLLSKFEIPLRKWSDQQAQDAHWRPNTINFTRNWLQEGLKDRAITRDLPYGVTLPPEVEAQDAAFQDKRIYVWFEAVIGYLSASQEWAQRQGTPEAWKDWWLQPSRVSRHYYFLGKDNIPFHTIIWPAMLLGYANGKGLAYQLPWDVPANEFMNFAGSKFSKSRGNVILVQDIVPRFQGDAVRYYLTANMPDARDADFTWDEFVRKVNDELVAALGNFCHRTLTFAHKHWGAVPDPRAHPAPAGEEERFEAAYGKPMAQDLASLTQHLEACWFKDGLRDVMAIAAKGNQLFNELRPWETIKTDKARCGRDLHRCLRVAKTLALAMAPFTPRAAQALWEQLGEPGHVHEQAWPKELASIAAGQALREPRVLFPKIDPATLKDLTGEPMPEPAPAQPATAPAAAASGKVSLADFQRLELRVAVVRDVQPHPKADKLYVIKVELGGGEERQLVAGLRAYVKPEELLGKPVIVVANLEPAVLRGVESQGMLLAAELDGKVVPLTTAGGIGAGAKVR
ncbi:MAG TPA: methionine--tRNA ligase [Candidatus Thermoplasmatota archaeon]|jgi:methionyl-tRNA synthetase|nr:methionine--tRNA ligase [Candidatus Thermoplasmatota archaeon]